MALVQAGPSCPRVAEEVCPGRGFFLRGSVGGPWSWDLWDQSAAGPKHAVVVEDPLQSCPKWVTVSGGPLLCHARCFLTRIERPEQRVDITAEH